MKTKETNLISFSDGKGKHKIPAKLIVKPNSIFRISGFVALDAEDSDTATLKLTVTDDWREDQA